MWRVPFKIVRSNKLFVDRNTNKKLQNRNRRLQKEEIPVIFLLQNI